MRDVYFRHDDFSWLKVAREWHDGTRSLAFGDTGVTPVYNLIYFALYERSGLDAHLQVAALIAAHAVCTVLVTLLVWAVAESLSAALAGGLCFALLFTHQEAVAWPAGGLHVFAAIPIALTALLWVHHRRGHGWALPVSVVTATIALFTKDTAVVVLPLLLVLEGTIYRDRRHTPLLWHLLPYVALVAWRVLLPPLREPSAIGAANYHLGWHILTNAALLPPQMVLLDLRFENYVDLLRRVLPGPLAGALPPLSVGLLALTALAGAVAAWRGSPRLRAALLWCVVGFLPALPFAYDYARAPRYGYIPSVGLALLVGLTVAAAQRRRRGALAWLVLGVYLLVSVGLLGLTAKNRLRDSGVRREVLATVQRELPQPAPGQAICLTGLPQQFLDLANAVPLVYADPVTCSVSDQPPPQAAVFAFDLQTPGRLQHYRPPP